MWTYWNLRIYKSLLVTLVVFARIRLVRDVLLTYLATLLSHCDSFLVVMEIRSLEVRFRWSIDLGTYWSMRHLVHFWVCRIWVSSLMSITYYGNSINISQFGLGRYGLFNCLTGYRKVLPGPELWKKKMSMMILTLICVEDLWKLFIKWKLVIIMEESLG